MPNRAEWEIVDDQPEPESWPRPGGDGLAGSPWKLACLAVLGVTALAGLAILAGIVALVLSLVAIATLGIVKIKVAVRRYGLSHRKSVDSLNRPVFRPSNL